MPVKDRSNSEPSLICEFCYNSDTTIKEYKYLATYFDKKVCTTLWLCSCCVEMVSKDKLVTS